MFKTHLLFGFLIGLLGIKFFAPHNQILFMLLALIGAALPDADHPNSKIGRKTKIFAMLFEHRGFMHSLFVLIPLLFIGLFLLSPVNAYALLIGYASHIVIDMVTIEGIMPFHPLSNFRIRGFIRTGHSLEYVVMGVLLVGVVYVLVGM